MEEMYELKLLVELESCKILCNYSVIEPGLNIRSHGFQANIITLFTTLCFSPPFYAPNE